MFFLRFATVEAVPYITFPIGLLFSLSRFVQTLLAPFRISHTFSTVSSTHIVTSLSSIGLFTVLRSAISVHERVHDFPLLRQP